MCEAETCKLLLVYNIICSLCMCRCFSTQSVCEYDAWDSKPTVAEQEMIVRWFLIVAISKLDPSLIFNHSNSKTWTLIQIQTLISIIQVQTLILIIPNWNLATFDKKWCHDSQDSS